MNVTLMTYEQYNNIYMLYNTIRCLFSWVLLFFIILSLCNHKQGVKTLKRYIVHYHMSLITNCDCHFNIVMYKT